MKVIVLAAGYATRLQSLAAGRPKALLEIGDAPILSRIIRRILELDGISEIVVVTNAKFAAQFAAWRRSFACPLPLRILNDGSTEERNKLGAIGDLAFALRHTPLDGEDWLVAAGDNLIEFDLKPLQRAFLHARRPMIVVREVERSAGPSPYNEVAVDGRGDVIRFREKPPHPQTGLAAIALYFFTPAVETLLARYLDAGGPRDAPGHFIAWLARETRVASCRFEGNWFDVGSPETLRNARAHLAPPRDPDSP